MSEAWYLADSNGILEEEQTHLEGHIFIILSCLYSVPGCNSKSHCAARG